MSQHHYKTKAPPLPTGVNPLAQIVGKVVAKFRTGWGLSVATAAKQLAIPESVLVYVEAGRLLPNNPLAERLRDWCIRGKDFTGMGPPRQLPVEVEQPKGFKVVQTKVGPELLKRLRLESRRIGLSQTAILHMALDWFLQERPALTTLAKAKQLLEQERAKLALQEAPALRDILQADIPMLLKVAKEKVPPPEEPAIIELAKQSSEVLNGKEIEAWGQDRDLYEEI